MGRLAGHEGHPFRLRFRLRSATLFGFSWGKALD
jgi:hypothetical protein